MNVEFGGNSLCCPAYYLMRCVRVLKLTIAVLLVTIFSSGCSDGESEIVAIDEIKEYYERLTQNDSDLTFRDLYETTENNYVVGITVSDGVEMTSDENDREYNIVITNRWQSKVCDNEIRGIKRKYDITWLSIRMYNKDGEFGSVALC